MKSLLLILLVLCSIALVSVYLLPLTTAQENSKQVNSTSLQQALETEELSQKKSLGETQGGDKLFNFVGAIKEGESAIASKLSVREQAVDINFHALSLESSEQISIPLLDGKTYTAIREKKEGYEWRGQNDYSWRGSIDGRSEWGVTLSIKDHALAGRISSPSGEYEIIPQKNYQILAEIDQSRAKDCAGSVYEPLSGKTEFSIDPLTIQTNKYIEQVNLEPQDTGTQIDVLILYTPAVRNALGGGTSQAHAFAQSAVDNTNQAFLNSGINPRVRLISSQEIEYTGANSEAGTIINWLRNNQTARSLRDLYKADLVSFIVNNVSDKDGIAYIMRRSNFSYAFAEDNAFSVVDRAEAVSNYDFAHELGHNLGADHHDDGGVAANLRVYPYAYGHRVVPGFRDIMSEPCYNILYPPTFDSCPRRQYFSTPNSTIGGQPLGVANQRDNARVINNTAYTVANFRDTSGCLRRAGEGAYADELTAFQYAYITGSSFLLGCPNALVRTDSFTSFAGTRSHFQTTTGGDIEYHTNGSRAGQAFAMLTPFLNKWASFGYNSNNPLGYPIGFVSLANTNSCFGTQNRYQSFEGGSLVQHLSGTRNGQIFEVHGAIHSRWASSGFAGCPLGLPISNEYVSNGHARSDFEGGYITTLDGINYQVFSYNQCNHSISPSSQSFSSGGGNGTINVTTNAGCNRTGTSNVAWISITSGGTGSGTVSYSVTSNSGQARTGTITIGNQIFTVNQSAAPTGCTSAMTFGQTVNGNLQSGDCLINGRYYDAYTFNGTAQQKVSIRLNSTQFDTYLYVYRGNYPGGILWSRDDDGGGGLNSRIPAYSGYLNLPANGTYTILVTSYAAGKSGSYTLSSGANVLVNPGISSKASYDFDSDEKTDYSFFRPSNGTWYFQSSSKDGFDSIQFGISTDKISPADFDGDGKSDVAVFRDGIWHLLQSTEGYTGVQFGQTGDIPQPSDFSGDGRSELVVYRPSNGVWYVLSLANNQFNAAQFGISTDKPVVGDYDGDRRADFAVYREGIWYLLGSTQGFSAIQFGVSTDKAVPTDYDGDGQTDVAVFRPSNGTWYLQRSSEGYTGIQFGLAADLPVPGDYDGDGKTDVAVFRAGTWYSQQSTAGFAGIQFGDASDKPIPNTYIP